MKYRTIGTDPRTRRTVSVLSLGAMLFGTAVDEQTSFAILDRFVEAGGTFIDTSNNYAFWVGSTQGGESEALLGRWRRSRGVGDEVTIATKLGGRPIAPGLGFADTALPQNIEGLTPEAIRESAARSQDALGMSTLDLLYAHVEDYLTPVDETDSSSMPLVRSGGTAALRATVPTWAVSAHTHVEGRRGDPSAFDKSYSIRR